MYNSMIQPRQTLYQADPAFSQSVKSVQESLFALCHQAMSRQVCVQMMNGQTYEGVITHIDEGHLYLRVSNTQARAFFNPWGPPQNDIILPLVLYNLLVISLL
ncbi:acetyl-CoA acetyltransferase [Paenibacillus athensensis]|uniref:Uncharacterized protein n=1 Tax=Paenibacillus athensensis TaxID=1967502 RepID=A0A4Y8PZK2_9BACL|nr:acetyl-CoA acetyltransferase [Paenibacillus athensensis]MCD1258564.1 acetyl-CoA acetyltransferase [Paenibacillus athensensis]